jgi:hypothetical protein
MKERFQTDLHASSWELRYDSVPLTEDSLFLTSETGSPATGEVTEKAS